MDSRERGWKERNGSRVRREKKEKRDTRGNMTEAQMCEEDRCEWTGSFHGFCV